MGCKNRGRNSHKIVENGCGTKSCHGIWNATTSECFTTMGYLSLFREMLYGISGAAWVGFGGF